MTVSIIRMYRIDAATHRPSHYREAWWDEEESEFVLHYGSVGELGTTEVETVGQTQEAEALFRSFVEQCSQDNYSPDYAIDHHTYTVSIKYKGQAPTTVEETNAEKFAVHYTGLLAWRGLGTVDEWHADVDSRAFTFEVSVVRLSKSMKLAHDALRKTDFRADRLTIERN